MASAVAGLAGVVLLTGTTAVPPAESRPAATRSAVDSLPVTTVPGAVTGAPVRATELLIPDLGLSGTLTQIGVDDAGELQPPPDPAVAGWFDGSSAPGDPGPSVIVGHVDSVVGPGVFFALAGLDIGAEVEVRRSDGRSVLFRVVDVFVVPKDEFPTARVYGPVPGPELRLITCGGEFDDSAGHYLRNVVVTAVPITR